MKTLHLTGLALAIAAGFALPLAGSAKPQWAGPFPRHRILPVEKAQFFLLGHNFCWYDGGWQGPGWYWCGYAWNNGYGWGGGEAGTAGTGRSGGAHLAARRAIRRTLYWPCAARQCRPCAQFHRATAPHGARPVLCLAAGRREQVISGGLAIPVLTRRLQLIIQAARTGS